MFPINCHHCGFIFLLFYDMILVSQLLPTSHHWDLLYMYIELSGFHFIASAVCGMNSAGQIVFI